jgi:hypothetical protein
VVTLYKGRQKPWHAKEVSPSRPSSIAREGAFTFPPEPARATPPPPKIAHPRRHELGCKETRVSGVSPEPGGETGFGSREPGQLAGQPHKHGGLQPKSAAEPVGRPRKRALSGRFILHLGPYFKKKLCTVDTLIHRSRDSD